MFVFIYLSHTCIHKTFRKIQLLHLSSVVCYTSHFIWTWDCCKQSLISTMNLWNKYLLNISINANPLKSCPISKLLDVRKIRSAMNDNCLVWLVLPHWLALSKRVTNPVCVSGFSNTSLYLVISDYKMKLEKWEQHLGYPTLEILTNHVFTQSPNKLSNYTPSMTFPLEFHNPSHTHIACPALYWTIWRNQIFLVRTSFGVAFNSALILSIASFQINL